MTSDELLPQKVLNKVTKRIIPLLLGLYIIAYLDRVNIGFAALQMNQDLGFSPTIYGLGSGMFFLGYFLFEVPSNLILEKIGARVWIARITITWGIMAIGMMFVNSPLSFYLLRFLLGIAEAGFYPGIILYFTYWFPSIQYAKTVALLLIGIPIAGILGGLISGILLNLDGTMGLAGWQWLFLLEGLPAIILGFIVPYYLCERPEQAEWLEPEELLWLQETLKLESELKEHHNSFTFLQVLVNPQIWLLSLIDFTLAISSYGISFWLPQIIKGFSGLSDLWVGFISSIPYLAGGIGMILISNHSDQTKERRAHVAIPALIGAFGLFLSAYFDHPVIIILSLSLALMGIWGTYVAFLGFIRILF